MAAENLHGVVIVLASSVFLTWLVEVSVAALGTASATSQGLAEAERIFRILERALLLLDLLAGLLALLLVVTRKFWLRHAPWTWAPPFRRTNLVSLREWLHGMPDSPIQLPGRVVKYVSLKEEKALTRLNREGFKDSPFEVELPKLERRNRSWIAKNGMIFMLIRNPFQPEDYIGFSSFLPLTQNGAELYRAGWLSDADIPAELVCSPEENPGCVLLFAVMLNREFSLSSGGASKHLFTYFLTSIAYHLSEIYKPLVERGLRPPLVAQTEEGPLRRRLIRLGFNGTSVKSADGFELLELERPFSPEAEPERPSIRVVSLVAAMVALLLCNLFFVGTRIRSRSSEPTLERRELRENRRRQGQIKPD